MDAYSSPSNLWQTAAFTDVSDEDFLAMLQKQFPSSVAPLPDGISPHSISRMPLPALTPPSEDSSPSPPQAANEPITTNRPVAENDDPALKRKASDDDYDEEAPNHKSQHLSGSPKKATPRRKSTDTPTGGGDQNRLLKRKEQNRAAQRAFRERKEKHVKDLEDRVANLQAKNEQAASENDNLKDLLARLQRENMMLKGATFSFSVPDRAVTTAVDPTASSQIFTPSPAVQLESPLTQFDTMSSASSPPAPTPTTQDAMFTNDSFDWNSLMSFDPAVLNLLNDDTQLTTTDSTTIPVDYGLAGPLSPKLPYMTIANNPGFMSFADAFDGSSPLIPVTDTNSFGYDIPSWPTPSQITQEPQPLDGMFNGNFMTQPVDFGFGAGNSSATISPVLHANARPNPSAPSSSSNSSSDAQSLFSQPRESSASISDEDHAAVSKTCPKSTEEFRRHIDASGPSPFVSVPAVHKSSDEHAGTIIGCQGAVLPKTEKNDRNIEVLAAWRDITSMFKDTDMTTLCAEFTSKAKCDGEKVVLEPQGVDHIVEKLRKGMS